MFADIKGTPFRYGPRFPTNSDCGHEIKEIGSAIFVPGSDFERITYCSSANRLVDYVRTNGVGAIILCNEV
jgi:hypothetical protein